jgi:hypothetical protein
MLDINNVSMANMLTSELIEGVEMRDLVLRRNVLANHQYLRPGHSPLHSVVVKGTFIAVLRRGRSQLLSVSVSVHFRATVFKIYKYIPSSSPVFHLINPFQLILLYKKI